MINFIKQAVESVEGIKSFLFNTDYRNNFDLQNVEFPCCVLTPIMRTNYDLNNIIRESAELQLSVVETAPYDYSGDDLYTINKRCSDLALQVIANLQVKSKLDKELTFEFILPSGDELISGVMCNLTATMKQGSCIGKPSYVEVIVQPIKRESITSNGKHIITPSSGFNAMREVEVEVQIGELTTEEKVVDITSNGEVEILPTNADVMTKVTANVQVPPPPLEEKQVAITRNGVTEIVPTSEYGLSRVEVSTDIPLESKQITITENGTTTIEASEGFEGIESVEVVTDVNTLQGLDLSQINYDAEQAKDFNNYLFDAIDRTIEAIITFNPNRKLDLSWSKTIFFPMAKGLESINSLSFQYAELLYVPPLLQLPNIKYLRFSFSGLALLRNLSLQLNKNIDVDLYGISYDSYGLVSFELHGTDSCKNFSYLMNANTFIEYVFIDNIESMETNTNMFGNIGYLARELTLKFRKWKKLNISLYRADGLTSKSIRYIIWHAMNGKNTLGFENQGAISRIFTLSATPYASWESWKLTKPSVEDCKYLGIDETEITKYGDLTWEDIALDIKLITIAK